jgi:hypothetical protein
MERKTSISKWNKELSDLRYSCKMKGLDPLQISKKIESHRDNEVKVILFDGALKKISDDINIKRGKASIMHFMRKS